MTVPQPPRPGPPTENRHIACLAQVRVLKGFLARARRSRGRESLRRAMQSALNILADMTGAASGSLFLFDDTEHVAEVILARQALGDAEARRLVGLVLEQGLAGWVRRQQRAGLVQDTLQDPRWLSLEDDPLEVRSALAVPILRGSSIFGILTLMHPAPGHFQAANLQLIQTTADQMALALENARLYDRLQCAFREAEAARQASEAYAAALDRQLEMGRRIQQDFLPDTGLSLPGWQAIARFVPALQVSGDFYDLFHLPGGLLGWSVGDVCDKGLGAALYMGLFRSLIRVFAGQSARAPHKRARVGTGPWGPADGRPKPPDGFHRPLAAVARTNRYVTDNHGRLGIFATVLFGVVDPPSGRLAYINAGHPTAYLLGPAGLKARLSATGPAMGLEPTSRFGVRQLVMDPGDILLSHTDGVTEARAPDGELFGSARLEALLARGADSVEELVGDLQRRLREFAAAGPQADDITILGLQRAGGHDSPEPSP